ncbi:MAG: ribosome silencing factor [Actinomycetes bacterium]|jgi:ribosome-associated protein|nr:ribosome silencing factor [Actinomycetes bacterium]
MAEPKEQAIDPKGKDASRSLVKIAFEAALDKKAADVMALDVSELLGVTDYFVLATGSNERQAQAISDEIEKRLREDAGVKPRGREGLREAKWILLDYNDIVVHIFQPDFRAEYRLEKLWAQAEKLRADTATVVGAVAGAVADANTAADTEADAVADVVAGANTTADTEAVADTATAAATETDTAVAAATDTETATTAVADTKTA